MELRDSPLWQEISSVAFDRKGLPPIYSWKAEFKIGDKTVSPFKVVSLSVIRNFRNNYGDAVVLEIMIAAGDFVYDIFPNRQNLVVTLSKEGRLRETDEPVFSPDIETEQFRAILLDEHSSSMTVEGLLNVAHSRAALNTIDILKIELQLLDFALERCRFHTVGGIFMDVVPAEILKYAFTTVSQNMDLDERSIVKGMDMVDSPNTDKYKQVVIPHGTKFFDLPKFVQSRVGGIYPTGLGVYLFRQIWYVYPLYDLTRFDNSIKTLTLINIPKNQLPGIEWTFRKTANQVIALVTGDVKHLDRTEAKIANEGNGVRWLDARRVIDGFADTSAGENKATVMRAENNNEFVIEQRDSGLNNIVVSPNRVTANKFAEASMLAQRTGAEIQCLWENSDMGAIFPGMPVKYLYIKDERVHELKGIVLGADHYVQTHGKGITETRHRTDTTLHLFVSREMTK